MTNHVVISGKGGSGKTTIAANLSAALADAGHRVMLVGCDSKGDTSTFLCSAPPVTLLEALHAYAPPQVADLVGLGYRGIGCVEIGSFFEQECPSGSIARCLQLLHSLEIIEAFAPTFVLYDVPGEFGCAGLSACFATAVDRIFVVASADPPALYAANALFRFTSRWGVHTDFIANGLTGSFEESLALDFAHRTKVTVAAAIPRSLVVRHSELSGKTVIESSPETNQAMVYRRLARHLQERGQRPCRPEPMPREELIQWARNWGERLGELEFGFLRDGAGI